MEEQGGNYLRELIRILIRNLGVLEKSEASCCGTTIAQCHAVVEIGRKEVVSLNELSELLDLDKSTMSRTINNLVGDNLVIREIHPEDRRYVTIELTEEGKKVFNSIEDSMEIYYQEILKSIPEDKREQVLESLQLLTEAVKQNKCC
ncbi:MAG: MarR family transcriptional regulator [Clostridiales bacterium]|jgi:DNA-binding MarR family transcriptional regulator|nr:MarR family transcriptional regulator [Clostridiales bacterium]